MGMPVTSGRLIELATSLDFVDIGRRQDFRDAARCVLVSKHEDDPLFDEAFDMFWRAWTQRREDDPLSKLIERLASELPKSQESPPRTLGRKQASDRADPTNVKTGEAASEGTDKSDVESIIAIYSPGEVLRHKDFAQMDQQEISEAKRFLTEVQWTMTRRRSLRARPSRKGKKLDVRRSVRRNLRHGGELLDLARRGPKLKRRQLVLLCDVSGSMDRYTRILLHFMHSVETSMQRVEVFVFGTRLTRITRALRKRDPDSAVAAVAHEVQDWAGGTRIGEALHHFNHVWARRVLGHGAVVLVISDGWDRGDPEMLTAEMARLQRASYRLIWLNPLLGSTNYRPLTQGIQAALPWVDDFLPVHNLASLEDLAGILNEIQEGRPARRQTYRRSAS
jgi:uncharacterized protein with von Willebrand factor type A (vWA) domain